MGTVVFSLDAELAWGFHAAPGSFKRRVRNARAGWRRTLALFDEFDVPATWTVVGHLLADDCTGDYVGCPESDGASAAAFGDPTTQRGQWFAPDLVGAVRDASVEHELGCHSFSHPRFGRVDDRAAIEADLQASADAARSLGVEFDSFVFPHNDIGHRDLLADRGYTCYRGTKPTEPYENSRFRRSWKTASYVLGRSPPVAEPVVDEYGLVNVPATLYLYGFEGEVGATVRTLTGDPVVRRAVANVDTVATEGGICHFWFHPNNLVSEADRERLRRVLAYVDQRRAAGEIEIRTMREVAATVRSSDTQHV